MYRVDVTPAIEDAYRVWWLSPERFSLAGRAVTDVRLFFDHASVTTATVSNFKTWTPIGTAASITFTVPMAGPEERLR